MYFLKQTHIVLQIASICLLNRVLGNENLDFEVTSAGFM